MLAIVLFKYVSSSMVTLLKAKLRGPKVTVLVLGTSRFPCVAERR